MLSNDFSGWGSAYPADRAAALRTLKENAEFHGSAWLDCYLPERAGFDPALLKTFGPSQCQSSRPR